MIINVNILKDIIDIDENYQIHNIPHFSNIEKLNKLYTKHHLINYYISTKYDTEKTIQLLQKYNCLYHRLKFIEQDELNNIQNFFSYNLNIKDHNTKFSEWIGDIPIFANFFKDKKVCLLGCGSSIDSYDIQFDKYDLVVGINRIYKTSIGKHINILYHNVSVKEWLSLPSLIEYCKDLTDFKKLIFCPWFHTKAKKIELYNILDSYNFQNYIYTISIVKRIPEIHKRPLTGVAALNHIIISGAKNIDIYGFDFYTNNYIGDLELFQQHFRYHNIESNKAFFSKLLYNNPNIKWYQ